MSAFRFVHAADLHLDSPFRGMTSLPDGIRQRIIDAPFQALRRLVAVALQEQVDGVLLSGDIYDQAIRSLRAQLAFQEAMLQLKEAQIQVFVVHGNHDPLGAQPSGLVLPDNVHVFGSEQVMMKPAYNRSGQMVAHVYGISYSQAAVKDNLALKYDVQDETVYNIAMLHCNVDGDQHHEPYAPCTLPQLIGRGMVYWALGHVHTRQVLHHKPYIVYPGNTQGRHVREVGAKGCYVVDICEQGTTTLTFHRTDTIVWQQVTLSIESMQSEQELISHIEAHIAEHRGLHDGRSVAMRLILEGEGSLHDRLQQLAWQEELLTWFRQKEAQLVQDDGTAVFVWLESLQVRTDSEWQRDKLLQENSFVSDVLRQSQRLQDGAALQTYAAEVMRPLLEHRIAGRYMNAFREEHLQQWLREAEKEAIRLLRAEWE